MRFVSIILLVALCSGCGPGGEPPPPINRHATADSLMTRTDRDAFTDAFDRLRKRPHTATLTVDVRNATGTVTGTLSRTIRQRPDAPHKVLRTSASGILGAGDHLRGSPLLESPLASVLPENPPHLDPRTRDQYGAEVLGDTTLFSKSFRLVAAVFNPESHRDQPVRRVEAAIDDNRAPVWMRVLRESDTVLLDERQSVEVTLAPIGGAWLPQTILIKTRSAVPTRPTRHLRMQWRVTSVGAVAEDSSSAS